MDSRAPGSQQATAASAEPSPAGVTRGRGLLASAKDPSSWQMPPGKEEAVPPPEGSRGGARESL